MDLLAKATALAAGVVSVVVASASTLDDDHSGLRYFEALLDRSFGLELRHKTLFWCGGSTSELCGPGPKQLLSSCRSRAPTN